MKLIKVFISYHPQLLPFVELHPSTTKSGILPPPSVKTSAKRLTWWFLTMVLLTWQLSYWKNKKNMWRPTCKLHFYYSSSTTEESSSSHRQCLLPWRAQAPWHYRWVAAITVGRADHRGGNHGWWAPPPALAVAGEPLGCHVSKTTIKNYQGSYFALVLTPEGDNIPGFAIEGCDLTNDKNWGR